MLVLSRTAGEAIKLGAADGDWVVTVLQVSGDTVSLRVTPVAGGAKRGSLDSNTHSLARDAGVQVDPSCRVTVVDIRGDKVRLGVGAPKDWSVHRLDLEDGLAGSRVPRPMSPKPPSLDVRLEQPQAEDERDSRGA